jgi:hypothetical protein
MDQIMGVLCLVLGAVLVLVLLMLIAYLSTLQKALHQVSPHNRLMEPGMVWLMLVPCVNLVWQFMIAIRVPDSLRNEFRERGQDDGSDYGKSIALTQAILGIVGGVASNVLSNTGGGEKIGALASGVLSLGCLAMFIVFWVKVANYSSQLASGGGRRRYDAGYDPDYGRGYDERFRNRGYDEQFRARGSDERDRGGHEDRGRDGGYDEHNFPGGGFSEPPPDPNRPDDRGQDR